MSHTWPPFAEHMLLFIVVASRKGTRPFCGAGLGFCLKRQLYSQTNSVCDSHSQFCQNAPQVQNEFPPSDPDLRTGGLCGVNNRNTNFRTNLREKPANSRWSVGFTALISCIYVLQTIPTQPVNGTCKIPRLPSTIPRIIVCYHSWLCPNESRTAG